MDRLYDAISQRLLEGRRSRSHLMLANVYRYSGPQQFVRTVQSDMMATRKGPSSSTSVAAAIWCPVRITSSDHGTASK
jgi:hypothetical protein